MLTALAHSACSQTHAFCVRLCTWSRVQQDLLKPVFQAHVSQRHPIDYCHLRCAAFCSCRPSSPSGSVYSSSDHCISTLHRQRIARMANVQFGGVVTPCGTRIVCKVCDLELDPISARQHLQVLLACSLRLLVIARLFFTRGCRTGRALNGWTGTARRRATPTATMEPRAATRRHPAAAQCPASPAACRLPPCTAESVTGPAAAAMR